MKLDTEQAKSICSEVKVPPEKISTGFSNIDEVIPLRRGDLWVIGARPRMGMTGFLLNLAEKLSFSGNRKVLFFTSEEPSWMLEERYMGIASGISERKVMTHEVEPQEAEHLEEIADKIGNGNIWFEDFYHKNVYELEVMIEKADPDVVFIDNLHAVADIYEGSNQFKRIFKSLKNLARKRNVAIITSSKVGRQVEMRPDHTPSMGMGELRSGISSSVDVVAFLYRDAFYNVHTADKESVVLIVEKGSFLPVPVRKGLWFRRNDENCQLEEEQRDDIYDINKNVSFYADEFDDDVDTDDGSDENKCLNVNISGNIKPIQALNIVEALKEIMSVESSVANVRIDDEQEEIKISILTQLNGNENES